MPKQILVDLNAKKFPGATGLYILVSDEEVDYEPLETTTMYALIDVEPGVYTLRVGVDAADRPRGTLSKAYEIEVLGPEIVIPPKPEEPVVRPAFPAPEISLSVIDAKDGGLALTPKKPQGPSTPPVLEPGTPSQQVNIRTPGPNGQGISLAPSGVFYGRDPNSYYKDDRYYVYSIAGPTSVTPKDGGDYMITPKDYIGPVTFIVHQAPSGKTFEYSGEVKA